MSDAINLPNGRLPDGWVIATLEEIATLQRGIDLPVQDRIVGDVPVYGSNGIDGYHDTAPFKGPGVITGRSGSIGFLHYQKGPYWPLNTTLYVKHFHGNHEQFVYYLLQIIELKKYAASTGVPSLNRNFVHPLRLAISLLPEQQKIARILTTVDNLIEKTEALIEKYKSIKQGMMHDLFTRGVDSTGQLRPPYEDAPHLYKQSPLGWIPKEWEATELGNACTWSSGGTPSKCNISYWQGEVPWASPKDMKTFELSDTIDHVSEEGAQAGSRLLEKGTVLIVIRGMILAHTFPVAIVCRRMAFNQDMKALVCNPAFQHRFLAHWLVAHSNHFLCLATESTHGTKRFDLADLYKLPFPFPSTDEQTAIVDRLDAVDGATNAEGDRLRNLKLQKTGLMQDLLTGKVRVNVDETGESNHPTESVSCGVGL